MDPIDIDSAEGFRRAVVAAVAEAVVRRARRLVLADPDFDAWPLEEGDFLAALTDFVRLPGRQVLLLARRFEGVARHRPRFVRWRQTWGHAVDARRPVDEEVAVPSLLLADRALMVELLDKEHWRGRVLQADGRVVVAAQEIDVLAQRTEPGWAGTTLGL